MITGYNHSEISIKSKNATEIVVKGENTAPVTYQVEDDVAIINTDNYASGEYAVQFFNGDKVLSQDVLIINENLKYVSSSYNPKSQARKILEAIDAYLAGRATEQMKKVQIGDKLIEYSSYDELMKWRQHFAKIVRKEEGRPSQVKLEKLYYRELI